MQQYLDQISKDMGKEVKEEELDEAMDRGKFEQEKMKLEKAVRAQFDKDYQTIHKNYMANRKTWKKITKNGAPTSDFDAIMTAYENALDELRKAL